MYERFCDRTKDRRGKGGERTGVADAEKKRWEKGPQKLEIWAFLVAQWLRIHLPMQGSQVPSLLPEDPTCCRATKPVHHNY